MQMVCFVATTFYPETISKYDVRNCSLYYFLPMSKKSITFASYVCLRYSATVTANLAAGMNLITEVCCVCIIDDPSQCMIKPVRVVSRSMKVARTTVCGSAEIDEFCLLVSARSLSAASLNSFSFLLHKILSLTRQLTMRKNRLSLFF